jgi:hypothetical protein
MNEGAQPTFLSGALRECGACSVHKFVRCSGQDRQREGPQLQSLALGGPLPAPLHGPMFVARQEISPGAARHMEAATTLIEAVTFALNTAFPKTRRLSCLPLCIWGQFWDSRREDSAYMPRSPRAVHGALPGAFI